jgi:hypothetical protein
VASAKILVVDDEQSIEIWSWAISSERAMKFKLLPMGLLDWSWRAA